MTAMTIEQARLLLTPVPPAPIVYSIADVERLLGASYTPEQCQVLEAVPFSEQTLRECAGNFMLFPGFPLDLLQLFALKPDLFGWRDWCADEKQTFSRREVPLQWHLLRTGPLPNSFGKSADAQVRLLPEGESLPGVAVVAFAAALHKLATGQELFGTDWYRTADLTAEGYWVFVSWYGGRLDVDYWLGRAYDHVGSCSARIS